MLKIQTSLKIFLILSIILLNIVLSQNKNIDLSGFISDKNTGEVLIGANIFLQNSNIGTSTDIKKPERQMGRSAAKRRQMAGEEYTPYDIVLEYLLSSKQAATIEEANYIMTEMDAKTIQSIVAE